MAARLFRTLAADEVVSERGIKAGVIGTGGRTYRFYSHGSPAVCCRCYFIARAVALLLFTWSVVMIIVSESNLSQLIHCSQRAAKEALPLSPSDGPGITDGEMAGFTAPNSREELLERFAGRIVYVKSRNPVVVAPLLSDNMFGLQFGRDVAQAHRVVEYCQWQEIQHSTRVLVGRDPACAHDDQGDSCNVYRTDVSFSYVKGWHSHLIPSSLFDNPVAYHNPQRAPCSSADLGSGRVCLVRVSETQCIHALGAEMEHGLLPTEHVQLDRDSFHRSSATEAAASGFTEWDRSYVYSRQPASSFGETVAHAALSYFVDGVVGFEGPSSMFCTPGDVRVHFTARRLSKAKGAAVAGLLTADLQVAPFACTADDLSEAAAGAHKLLLSYPNGDMALDDFLAAVVHDAKKSAWWYRLWGALLTGLALVLVYFSCRPHRESFLSD